MTPDYVIVWIKLCLDVRKDEYIILSHSGGYIIGELSSERLLLDPLNLN